MVGFVFSAIVAIPVYFSGEDAEHEVEHLQGIEEFRIEAHEESAGLSFALILVSGIVAAAGLYFREKYSRLIMFALIIVSLAASASLTYTGFLGGKIRHSELSKDTLKGDVLHEHVHD
ncbi:MAG: hypothetical protein DWQ44_11595 [Bacteroidetes bacterium]|nr:MAG: hypothetical protein DWQ33_09715 [Bacteroidota bacterium]REK05264.1 MAG: hypothetical protein DWQ39_08725 [Bacteroidota bacterium]REK32669.1 MAG: hypothetical protein DWQ44_11595 [Bacteroidota bacterium]REK48884.1 MAG: hypothetical protein DWQ48_08365 [Bacteroidota bacterium]